MTNQFPEITPRYRIISLLGKGGMGEVYKAHDSILDIDVAIKVLPSSLAEIGAARLQREAIALAKLKHQNIASVIDFASTKDGSPYMVMEYLEGQPLDKLAKQKEKVSLLTSINLFKQICQGLQYAHNQGIIHRDLKPSNIIVLNFEQTEPVAKILDLGVAKVASENQRLTATDALVGSPLYMSPEQAQGMADEPGTDIYSLGCLMFEVLTGLPPLKGATVLETLSMHRNTAPPLISDFDPSNGFPSRLINLVDRCLRKDPTQRPKTALEIFEELEQIWNPISYEPNPEAQTINEQKSHTSKTATIFSIISGLVVCALLAFSLWKTPIVKQEPKTKAQKPEIKNAEITNFAPENNFRQKDKTAISAAPLKDADLAQLQTWDIDTLLTTNSNLSGSGLEFISNKPMKEIKLEKSLFRDENSYLLSKFKTLESLHLESPYLSDKSIEPLTKCPSLTKIQLYSDLLTDKTFQYLSNLNKLQILGVDSNKTSSDGLRYLQNSRQLTILKLEKINCNSNLGENLAKIKSLKILTLEQPQNFNLECLKGIEKSKIESILLEKIALNQKCINAILACPSLYAIEFNQCTLDNDALKNAKNFKNLKVLHFMNMKSISYQLMMDICKTQVIELTFKESELDDSKARLLASMKSLSSLTIQDSEVSDKTLDEIKRGYETVFRKKLQVSDTVPH